MAGLAGLIIGPIPVYGHQTVRENALRGAFRQLFPGFLYAFLGTARARAMRADAGRPIRALSCSTSRRRA